MRITSSPQQQQQQKGVEESFISIWPGAAGATALRQVQFLASTASNSAEAMDESQYSLATRRKNQLTPEAAANTQRMTNRYIDVQKVFRTRRRQQNAKSKDPGGGIFNNAEFNTLAQKADVTKLKRSDLEVRSTDKREEQVWTALANLELDSEYIGLVEGVGV